LLLTGRMTIISFTSARRFKRLHLQPSISEPVMAKWLSALLFLLYTMAVFGQNTPTVFYVAPNGKAGNPGTKERPFATPQQARDTVRKAKSKAPGQTYAVYFRGGDYPFAESFELLAQDSGALDHPVVYAGVEGENVVFYGGKYLHPGDFQAVSDPAVLERLLPEARGKVLEIDLKKAGITQFGVLKQHGFGVIPEPAPLELFINGARQTPARFPNEGKVQVGKVFDLGSIPRNGDYSNRGATFGYEYERPKRWMQARDIWLHGKFSYGYNDDNLRIAEIHTVQKSFTMAQAHIYGVKSGIYVDTSNWHDMAGLSTRGYYAYNLLEEIDQPGEWFLDRETGILYCLPPEGFADARLEISMLEAPMVRMVHTAHIHFENIAFSTSRGMGVYLENAHYIDIERCTFRQLGTVALSAGQPLQQNIQRYAPDGSGVDYWLSQDFHHIRIRNCRVYRTGAGGIILSGGDRKRLVPAENEVEYCAFFQTDQINATYSPAIKLAGVGTTVSHCHFHDQKHMVIWLFGNEHRIENCLFERVCTDADDMGAIYTGRDPSARGAIIRGNHFRDILPPDADSQVGAVFLDDGISGFEIDHNFFERTGGRGDQEMFGCIAINGGHDNSIHHNVFLDCEVAIGNKYWTDEIWKKYLESAVILERLQTIVDISGPVYQQRYPALKNYFTDYGHRLNKLYENILINSNMALQGKLELDHNHIYGREKWKKALEKIGFKEVEVGLESGR